MSKTKLCKACKQPIDSRANKCPHCQTKQGIGCMGCFLGIILCTIIITVIVSISLNSTTRSTPIPTQTATPEPIATNTPAPTPTPYPSPFPPLSDISEAERQRIYMEIYKAGLRAIHEADTQWPDFGPEHQRYAEEYSLKYEQAVYDTYNIDDNEQQDLSIEAYEKNWGTPE